MSDNPINSPITINSVIVKKGGPNSGDKDIDNLMHCFFEEVGQSNKYRFYSSTGDHIPTIPEELTSGEDFQFIRTGMLWKVWDFVIGNGQGSGNWENARHPKAGDDDGSFQAQSGGGVEVSSAKA